MEPLPTSPGIDSSEESVVPKPEVQDWIAKARESLQAFGELIPAAAASSSNDDVRDADGGASGDEGADDSDGDTGYDTADEHLPSGSSPAPPTKKKDPKLIPEEAPYGLMARMSIKSRQKSAEPETSDAIGVANVDFFRPSMSSWISHYTCQTKYHHRSCSRSNSCQPTLLRPAIHSDTRDCVSTRSRSAV